MGDAIVCWKISVPIFQNAVILKQLGIAVGVPFGLLAAILWLTTGEIVYALSILGILAALLFLTWLFLLALYRGRYDAEFVLDGKGVVCRTQERQAKKNRIVNTLTVLLGLFSGKPAVAGAGMLAQSRQEVFIRWSRVTRVKYKPRSRTILIRSGLMDNIALFCTAENYPQIEQRVMERTRHLQRGSR